MIRLDGFAIDVATMIDLTRESEVTDYPVETGASVADHKVVRPVMLSIEGVVSDTPIGEMIAEREQLTIVDGEAFYRPSDEARAKLIAIDDAREPIRIETERAVYENMLLQTLTIPDRADVGEALRFSATFKQVKLVTNERTTVRVSVPRAAKKVNRGAKAAPESEPPEATGSRLGSLLGL